MSEQLVQPYCCVMSIMLGHFQGGHYVVKSLNIVRDRLREQGYLVSRVRSLWSPRGDFLGMVVVEFGTTDAYCESAFKLQSMFEMREHGYSNWISNANLGDEPYIWVATPQDRRRLRGGLGLVYTEVPATVLANALVCICNLIPIVVLFKPNKSFLKLQAKRASFITALEEGTRFQTTEVTVAVNTVERLRVHVQFIGEVHLTAKQYKILNGKRQRSGSGRLICSNFLELRIWNINLQPTSLSLECTPGLKTLQNV